MENENPLISVVVAAYNSEHCIEETVNSITSQDYKNLEIILIDDCSTDGTLEILAKLKESDKRIKILKNDINKGVAYSRNVGFELVRGEYTAICDSDDVWDIEKISRQYEAILLTKADLCYTSYRFIDKDSIEIKKPYIVPETISYNEILKENVIGCSTVLLKTELIKEYKMNSDYYLEDYSLWLQILRDGYKVVGIKEPLVSYRLLEGSRSADKLNSMRQRNRLLKEQEHIPFFKRMWNMAIYIFRAIKKYFRK